MARRIQTVELAYPALSDAKVNAIEIELIDVRASNSLLVEFSHARNGWVISMPSKTSWDAEDAVCDPCYREQAFIPAWAVGNEGAGA